MEELGAEESGDHGIDIGRDLLVLEDPGAVSPPDQDLLKAPEKYERVDVRGELGSM